ncbi:copper radical oxidase [Cylindrobasidium torrendii FP15055 ss-10]|uniref:Copper radical oxidase n=1 Tax=Cylindrobasidium torrendii FP15055 ss-10 TaxID=1314674 RepID=A0A0D7BQ16_9AGAR|nr:copper radical oxidase [Cylindrobasidium torrendii FP15055 ss-10]
MISPSLFALAAAAASASTASAQTPNTFSQAGSSLVSAMMMFLGNDDMVYIMDKAEGNEAQVNGHPAWGSVWDIKTHEATVQDIRSNIFCSSGIHLPNGSFVTFGGNGAVTKGGDMGSVLNDGGYSASFDELYQDYDGTKAIRILNPCPAGSDFSSSECGWYDNADVLSMKKQRWYSTAEPDATGRVVIIGGYTSGGYINRNYPNTDPEFEGGAATCTYEFYPPEDGDAPTMQFLIDTSGLNSYPHTFLLASGKMFLQANTSTMIWDIDTNKETRLPEMPGNVVRVYPGSGGTAMLPMTPANNYEQTILFCGGNDMPDYSWGNYSWPYADTFYIPASKDCQRITPEPADGSDPVYVQDEDMLEGRTMGQFIILPTGKLFMVNGGENGTAGYSTMTLETTSYSDMPYGMSLAAQPALTPSIYDPNAEKGKRWSNDGFEAAKFPRLYHSSALLLPDASVLIGGSNPNVDVNLTTYFPTTYDLEIFYPPYFSAKTRPSFSGAPDKLTYGGKYFDLKIAADSYSGSSNDAAKSATCVVIRPGWTTHGMNMGQRFLQLNNTYTVNDDGTIDLHCSQMPPNANLFQPGPAMLFVTVNDIPSNGTHLTVGSGNIETQPTSDVAALPTSKEASSSASGSGTNTGTDSDSDDSGSHTGAIVGGVVGALVVVGIIGAIVGICVARRRRARAQEATSAGYAMRESPSHGAAAGYAAGAAGGAAASRDLRSSDSSAFVPLQNNYNPYQQDGTWSSSQVSLQSPYQDHHFADSRANGMSMDIDPYAAEPMRVGTPTRPQRY